MSLDGSEHVLCLPADDVDFTVDPGFSTVSDGFIAAVNGRAVFKSRTEALEHDPSWKQVVAYAVVRRGNRFVAYVRRPTGSERRLHGLWSVGVGGHVNPGDLIRPAVVALPARTLMDAVRVAAAREVSEELGVAAAVLDGPVGVLYDPDDPSGVGSVHVGVVYLFGVALGVAFSPSDDLDVVDVDPSRVDSARFEGWSRLLLPFLSFLSAVLSGP